MALESQRRQDHDDSPEKVFSFQCGLSSLAEGISGQRREARDRRERIQHQQQPTTTTAAAAAATEPAAAAAHGISESDKK